MYQVKRLMTQATHDRIIRTALALHFLQFQPGGDADLVVNAVQNVCIRQLQPPPKNHGARFQGSNCLQSSTDFIAAAF
jgi:hypothetical protein